MEDSIKVIVSFVEDIVLTLDVQERVKIVAQTC